MIMVSLEYLARDFFFQAENGIRDADVAGVQTCALPISNARQPRGGRFSLRLKEKRPPRGWRALAPLHRRVQPRQARRSSAISRSEERRVGKVCRLKWAERWSNKILKQKANIEMR